MSTKNPYKLYFILLPGGDSFVTQLVNLEITRNYIRFRYKRKKELKKKQKCEDILNSESVQLKLDL